MNCGGYNVWYKRGDDAAACTGTGGTRHRGQKARAAQAAVHSPPSSRPTCAQGQGNLLQEGAKARGFELRSLIICMLPAPPGRARYTTQGTPGAAGGGPLTVCLISAGAGWGEARRGRAFGPAPPVALRRATASPISPPSHRRAFAFPDPRNRVRWPDFRPLRPAEA